jgi:hypothetical protein
MLWHGIDPRGPAFPGTHATAWACMRACMRRDLWESATYGRALCGALFASARAHYHRDIRSAVVIQSADPKQHTIPECFLCEPRRYA